MLIIQRPSVEVLDEEVEGRQRFAIGPLEPGFGHTLGNSLRRVLLSSIPGAAITRVKFDDALHEFTVIKGVKEDVMDIILNLKDIVFTSESSEPVTLRCEVKGSAEVTAGDIQLTSDIEIINPDLHIATVNSNGVLGMDITVEQGRGYATAEQNKLGNTIGVIPIDSIFSPARRVSFVVEPVRVEQSTDYDRLVMDITTDGALSPRSALASAASTMTSLLDILVHLDDEPKGLELGDVASVSSGSPDLELDIEELDLSERPRNCLKRAQILTVGELVRHSSDELLAITNFGQKSLDEVLEKLDERGLSLRMR
jgi:DNA-directed RNA polymerase subunit alpha